MHDCHRLISVDADRPSAGRWANKKTGQWPVFKCPFVVRLVANDHLGADLDLIVEMGDVVIGHADATR